MSGLTMTRAAAEAFLAEPRVAVLSVTEPGRGPLASPLWYRYAPGGDIAFVTPRSSRKGRLIALRTRLSLCVQQETRPYKYVSVEGPVARIDVADWQADLMGIAIRYLGEDEGRAYAAGMRAAMADGSRMMVHMAPERWLTADYSKRT